MRERVRDLLGALDESAPPVAPDERAEARDLLEWIHDDHFTFLGYREYDILAEDGEDVLRAVSGSGLGILRAGDDRPVSVSFAQLSPEVRRLAREKSLLRLTKANSRATVHRPAYLDYIGVKRFDASGEVAGEWRFLGLYTHTAYSESPWAIPVLRRKAQRVVDRSGLSLGSHDYKALVEILETYPRDELFQISEDKLLETALGILHLDERRRVRLFVRRDAFGRFSLLSRLPAAGALRHEESAADRRDPPAGFRRRQRRLHDAALGVGARARPLRRLHEAGRDSGVRRRRDRDPARRGDAAWTDDLRDALAELLGEEHGAPLFERYGDAFPGAYREDFRSPGGCWTSTGSSGSTPTATSA